VCLPDVFVRLCQLKILGDAVEIDEHVPEICDRYVSEDKIPQYCGQQDGRKGKFYL